MRDKLNSIKEEALKQIQSSDALEKLNDVRVAFLGKKGELTGCIEEHEGSGCRRSVPSSARW